MSEYPALVISPDIVALESSFQDKGVFVNIVKDVESLKYFLLKYANIITKSVIALSDLACLGVYKSRMLKFIEEQTSPIVCLSSCDSIPGVLMSRFMTIIKYPTIVRTENDSFSYIRSYLSQQESSESIPPEMFTKYCPSGSEHFYYLKKSNLVAKNKIMSLVYGGNS